MSTYKENIKRIIKELIIIGLLCMAVSIFFNGKNSVFCQAEAKTKVSSKAVKTIKLKNNNVKKVFISHRGGVLNFPSKPSKVILGNSNSFAIEYVNSDLVISPLISNARAHIFVYLGDRRFNLDIIASSSGSTVIQVRDALEGNIEVPYAK